MKLAQYSYVHIQLSHCLQAVAEYLGYTHKYSNLPGISIHWPHHSGPPANKPKCGYVGELCKTYGMLKYLHPDISMVPWFSLLYYIMVFLGHAYFFHKISLAIIAFV